MTEIFAGEAKMDILSEEAADTIRKVRELAAHREEYIRKKGLTISFKHSCYKLRISPQTVKRHAPELAEKWDDINFHWEIAEEHK